MAFWAQKLYLDLNTTTGTEDGRKLETCGVVGEFSGDRSNGEEIRSFFKLREDL